MNELLIQAQDYELTTPTRQLLQTINLTLQKAEVLCILGPNGCGKSTLLKNIYKAYNKYPIKTLFFTQETTLCYLPQSLNNEFFIPITLKEFCNLREPVGPDPLNLSHLLPPFSDKKLWNYSSGGERQRALLVQTLQQDKEIYLLDEPFNHLDEKGIEEFSTVISCLSQKHNKSFIITTHSVPKSLKYRSLNLS